MASEETITLTRREYSALIERNSQLEDMVAARDADDGVRVPHEVALDIMRGKSPILAFRNHQGITLRELSERTGIAAGYISEVERGLKPVPIRLTRWLATTVWGVGTIRGPAMVTLTLSSSLPASTNSS